MPLLKATVNLLRKFPKETMLVVDRTVDILSEKGGSDGLIVFAKAVIPTTVGSYAVWVDKLGFVGPLQIVRINYKVFRACMQYTKGNLLLSCIGTSVICTIQVVSKVHRGASVIICQALFSFTYNFVDK